jgi:hypothetical protein
MSFDDPAVAIAIRDAVKTFAKQVIDEQFPPSESGRVQSIDHIGGTCMVLFPGHTESVQIKLRPGMHPSRAALDYPTLPEWGDVVRVEGGLGDRYVSEVLVGGPRLEKPRLYNPRISTSLNVDDGALSYFAVSVPPANSGSGYVSHVGRWENERNEAVDGAVITSGKFDIKITENAYADMEKEYSFFLSEFGNGTYGVWKTLLPTESTGMGILRDFNLEIMFDGSGFELRIRCTGHYYGSTAVGQYKLVMSTTSKNLVYIEGSQLGVMSGQSVPTEAFQSLGYYGYGSPFGGNGSRVPRLVESAMTGGGIVSWDGTNLGWSQRFICMGVGVNEATPFGYISITVPANGTNISVWHDSFRGSVTVSGGTIPFGGYWGSLYFVPDWGNTTDPGAGYFTIVSYTQDSVINGDPGYIPSHWILVASHNRDGWGSPSLRLGNGDMIDHWRAPSLVNSWTNYGSGYSDAGYRKVPGGNIQLRGLVRNGSSANALIFTLPVGYRPPTAVRIPVNISSNIFGSLQIGADGTVAGSPGAVGYIFLDGVQFHTD